MHESMVKFALVLIGLLSLAAGGILLVIPGWYVELSGTESANEAWMRFFGASLVTLQGFGLMLAAFRRRDTNPLLTLIALATTVESGVLWYSLVAGEFAAEALWAVVVPGVVATASAVLLWGVWASRRKSVKLLGGAGAQVDAEPGTAMAAEPTDPGAAPDTNDRDPG
jgi:hypothetical protein